MKLKTWLIHKLRNNESGARASRVPFYVAGDGVAYTKASEVLNATAVKKQLDDVRKLRELSGSGSARC